MTDAVQADYGTAIFNEIRKAAFKFSAGLQAGFLLVASIVLDDGSMLAMMSIAAAAYWLAVAIIRIRRRGSAAITDRLYFRWGFLVMVVLTALVSIAVMAIRGWHA